MNNPNQSGRITCPECLTAVYSDELSEDGYQCIDCELEEKQLEDNND